MKHSFFFLIFLVSLQAAAQDRTVLHGKAVKQDSILENVHVQNVTTGKYAITDEEGIFYLSSRTGDTLLLSHVSTRPLVRILTEEDLNANPLIIRFPAGEVELDEVILDEYSHINAVSLGIIPKKIEKLSVQERRLKAAGDFKPKHLLGVFLGGLQLEPILNALNGRTKELKRNVSIEEKLANISYLENNFSGYMKKEMEMDEQEIAMLIRYAVEEEQLQSIIDSKNYAALKFFLHDTWIKFQEE